MTQETEDKFSFVPIPEEWGPVDEESGQQRALFLCHAVDGHIRQNFYRLIAKCREGAYGKHAQVAAQRKIDEWIVASAIKEATCICIYRAWLEQASEEPPSWLIDFIYTSLNEAEEICAQPGAAEIIDEAEQLEYESLIPDLVAKLCDDFGLSYDDEAAHVLHALLESACDLTRELLLLSLTQPPESLHRHLKMYQQ